MLEMNHLHKLYNHLKPSHSLVDNSTTCKLHIGHSGLLLNYNDGDNHCQQNS